MTLFTDTLNFFRRERRWGLLFLVVIAIYSFHFFWPVTPVEEPPSRALEELRLAELRLKEEIRTAGGVREYLVEKPRLLFLFNVFTICLIAILVLGLMFDFLWLLWPRCRATLGGSEGPPEARHWNVGTVFKVLLLFISFAIIFGFLLSLFRSRFFPDVSPNLLPLIHTTISDLVAIGLVIYFLRRLGGDWRELGFGRAQVWKDLKIGLAGYAAILPLFFLVLVSAAYVAYLLSYEPPPHPLVEIFLEEEKRAPGIVVYSVFLACVAGPFFEEIFFRGFCYPAFKKRWGIVWSLILSSAFFAWIHQNTFAFWPIFILGLGLGYLYEKRGSLVPSITVHILHNSIFIGYFFLAKQALVG